MFKSTDILKIVISLVHFKNNVTRDTTVQRITMKTHLKTNVIKSRTVDKTCVNSHLWQQKALPRRGVVLWGEGYQLTSPRPPTNISSLISRFWVCEILGIWKCVLMYTYSPSEEFSKSRWKSVTRIYPIISCIIIYHDVQYNNCY